MNSVPEIDSGAGVRTAPDRAEPGPDVPERQSSLFPARGEQTLFGLVMARLLPPVLLLVSWLVTAVTHVPEVVIAERLLPALLLTGVILLLRVLAELLAVRVRTGTVGWTIAWFLHAAAVLALILLNPFTCIYAFAGYIDAERFLGRRAVLPAVGMTALLSALGQTGGAPGVRNMPELFVALVVINLVVAGGMMRLATERERQVQARVEAAEEVARIHRQNLALQQDLLAEARQRGVAAERERLSREIHDTVAQGLVAVITQLESVPTHADPRIRSRIERAEQSARDSLAEARRAVAALASPLLDDRDLAEAMAELVRTWSDTHDIGAQFTQDGSVTRCRHPDVLIRVAQEALSNVARHAGAGRAAVTLTGDADEVRLDIGDDGSGFDPTTVDYGRGLASIRDRITAVGGSFAVETSAGDGCTLTVAVPR